MGLHIPGAFLRLRVRLVSEELVSESQLFLPRDADPSQSFLGHRAVLFRAVDSQIFAAQLLGDDRSCSAAEEGVGESSNGTGQYSTIGRQGLARPLGAWKRSKFRFPGLRRLRRLHPGLA